MSRDMDEVAELPEEQRQSSEIAAWQEVVAGQNVDAHYRSPAMLRNDLRMATCDLALSEREDRILEWLSGFDQDTVGPIITLLHKARRGDMEPPMPNWVGRYT